MLALTATVAPPLRADAETVALLDRAEAEARRGTGIVSSATGRGPRS